MSLQPAEPMPFPPDLRVREMLGHDVYDMSDLADREEVLPQVSVRNVKLFQAFPPPAVMLTVSCRPGSAPASHPRPSPPSS